MDAPSPIPFRSAQATAAYGARGATRPTVSATRSADGSIIPPQVRSDLVGRAGVAATDASQPSDRLRLDVTSRRDHLSSSLEALIAGTVESPIGKGEGFDQPAPARTVTPIGARAGTPAGTQLATPPSTAPIAGQRPQTYAMYSRAADRLEVATTIRVGQNLDARG